MLVQKLTRRDESNNQSFKYYNHVVDVQSGTCDYKVVTIYISDSRYDGVLVSFSFDFWTKELDFVVLTDNSAADKVLDSFRKIYGMNTVKVSGLKQEDTAA